MTENIFLEDGTIDLIIHCRDGVSSTEVEKTLASNLSDFLPYVRGEQYLCAFINGKEYRRFFKGVLEETARGLQDKIEPIVPVEVSHLISNVYVIGASYLSPRELLKNRKT